MRLELGSGDRPTPGFVHFDARRDVPHVDLIGDVRRIGHSGRARGYDGPFPAPGSCEEIRAAHLLEHISWRETVPTLEHWREYLRPGGQLTLEVPNLTGHMRQWREGGSSDAQLVTYLFGEQDYPENFHQTMFTGSTLRESLQRAGFKQVRVTDIGLVLRAEAVR